MRNSRSKKSYWFGDFRLDAAHLLLYQNGREVSLTPKIVETLLALVERSGEVLSKDELMEIVWAGSIVEESNLSQNLYLLRKILFEPVNGKPLIETLKRRGYRFNGVVSEAEPAQPMILELNGNQNANKNAAFVANEHDPKIELLETLSPLIGREADIALVKNLLSQTGVRLVTLAGVGGIGKTSIARAVMRDIKGAFAEGAAFVELASIANPELIASTIFQSLGLTEAGGKPVLEVLKNYLRTREMLLVIDNFEQVLTAAPLISELLAAAAHLKILITSRVLLRVQEEKEFIVSPLVLPAADADDSLSELANYSAVKLFVERARVVKPDFALTKENIRETTEICQRLDGLPLAIELAAARARLLTPAALLKRLNNRLQILSSSDRQDAPSRQRTMRDAIAWSYDLLETREKTLFQKLSVFSGGFTIEAAEAVCGYEGGTEVLDGLEILAASSLIQSIGSASGEARLTMFETIREFSRENLAEDQTAYDETRSRHADYFLIFARQIVGDLYGANQTHLFTQLQIELDNFRAALECYEKTGSVKEMELCATLSPFWNFRGYLTEGGKRLRDALARHPLAPTVWRAAALTALGEVVWFSGDYPQAIEICEKSLALARQADNQRLCARSLFILGMSYWYQFGDGEEANALLEESLGFYRELKFDTGVTLTLVVLAAIRQSKNDLVRAKELLDESLVAAERSQNNLSRSVALVNYGRLLFAKGDFARAKDLCCQSLRLREKIADRWGLVQCLAPLASIAVAEGETRRAAKLHGAIDSLLKSIGATPPPILTADHESSLTAARAALEEQAFTESFGKGQKLSPKEIFCFALSLTKEFHA